MDRILTDRYPRAQLRFFADEMHNRAWPRFLGRAHMRRPLLVAFALFTIGLDYVTGPTIRFPAYSAVPILLFAWYEGFLWGSVASAIIVGARFALEAWIWPSVPWPLRDSVVNAITVYAMVLVIVWFTSRAGRLSREVRLLWGLMPLCMYCHRIRTEKGEWEKLEQYITERSQAAFSHGICPTCMESKLA
jgi:hypothetical protein